MSQQSPAANANDQLATTPQVATHQPATTPQVASPQLLPPQIATIQPAPSQVSTFQPVPLQSSPQINSLYPPQSPTPPPLVNPINSFLSFLQSFSQPIPQSPTPSNQQSPAIDVESLKREITDSITSTITTQFIESKIAEITKPGQKLDLNTPFMKSVIRAINTKKKCHRSHTFKKPTKVPLKKRRFYAPILHIIKKEKHQQNVSRKKFIENDLPKIVTDQIAKKKFISSDDWLPKFKDTLLKVSLPTDVQAVTNLIQENFEDNLIQTSQYEEMQKDLTSYNERIKTLEKVHHNLNDVVAAYDSAKARINNFSTDLRAFSERLQRLEKDFRYTNSNADSIRKSEARFQNLESFQKDSQPAINRLKSNFSAQDEREKVFELICEMEVYVKSYSNIIDFKQKEMYRMFESASKKYLLPKYQKEWQEAFQVLHGKNHYQIAIQKAIQTLKEIYEIDRNDPNQFKLFKNVF